MKNKKKKQSPAEIRKQIIQDLKKESDPIQQELLKQRLYHYNLICKNTKN